MTVALEQSYAQCAAIARRAASTFFYSFYLLPRPKRRAMCALYAFLRKTDDVGDCYRPLCERRAALDQWRSELTAALDRKFDDLIFPALVDTLDRFSVPSHYLFDVIEGVEMDLDGQRYETFADLERYCQRVASAVGLACLHVWELSLVRDPAESASEGGLGRDALPAGSRLNDEAISDEILTQARACGVAFQLTNILRDIKEDADRGRCYLPEEDLRRCNYSFEDLKAGVADERFRKLMDLEFGRAEDYYQQAAGLHSRLSCEGRRVFGAMFTTYRHLLRTIRHREGEMLTRRIGLGRWQKFRIAARWMLPGAGQSFKAVCCDRTSAGVSEQYES